MIENALTAGLTSTGMNVLLLGPVPTPAVGLPDPVDACRSGHHDIGQPQPGAMTTASSSSDPTASSCRTRPRRRSRRFWRARSSLRSRTISVAPSGSTMRAGAMWNTRKPRFRRRGQLVGLKVVVDCANGAAYRAAPEVLWELGADVIPVGVASQRLQHQRPLWLDPPAHGGRGCGGAWRRCRHLSGWRRGPGDDPRRKRRGGGRRSDHGAAGGALGCVRAAAGRGAGGHGDVEPRAGTVPGTPGPAAGTHAGRRPLCGRARCAKAASTWAANNPAIS